MAQALQIVNHRYVRVTDSLCQDLHFRNIFVFILELQLLSRLFSPKEAVMLGREVKFCNE